MIDLEPNESADLSAKGEKRLLADGVSNLELDNAVKRLRAAAYNTLPNVYLRDASPIDDLKLLLAEYDRLIK